MKGRMPFPIPFLPMIVVVFSVSWASSKFLNSCGEERARNVDLQINSKKDAALDEPVTADPFSDDPEQRACASEAAPVRITTKYVEIGSGDEELKFDWVVEPGKLVTEKKE